MVCGPGCSGFCAAISLWGIIFLAVLGGLFWNESVGLFEDLPELTTNDWGKSSAAIDDLITQNYQQAAKNCWIAMAVSIAVFVLSVLRFMQTLRNH
uniref:Ribonuclease kappa n=1 Tax=Parastrongyloides trichosuri TaxID=131310 RepID=A0A0N5A4A2_PARTI